MWRVQEGRVSSTLGSSTSGQNQEVCTENMIGNMILCRDWFDMDAEQATATALLVYKPNDHLDWPTMTQL